MKRKKVIEIRDLRVNMAKTKLMVSGAGDTEPVPLGRYSCGVCGRRVGVKSILCTRYDTWCHVRWSGLRSFNTSHVFVCPKFAPRSQTTGEPSIDVDGEVVDSFCYLGDVVVVALPGVPPDAVPTG